MIALVVIGCYLGAIALIVLGLVIGRRPAERSIARHREAARTYRP